jgi:hypothetical protein
MNAVTEQGRNPYEAEKPGPDGSSSLNALLDACRVASTRAPDGAKILKPLLRQ